MSSAQYEQLSPIIVASMRHHGKHTPDEVGSTWEDLILWASPRRLLGRNMDIRGVGLLWDDPRVWPPEMRRYDVGIPIDAEDSPEVDEPAFINLTMPGKYLKATHEGPYDGVMKTYDDILSMTLKFEGLELVSAPIIELYRNSPQEVHEDELRTDIYFPVTRL